MRLVILDNALHDVGSHAYNNASALVHGMTAKGVLVEVFGCGYMDPRIRQELGATQHFQRSFYDPVSVEGDDAEQVNWERMNLDYCEDLLRLPDDIWTTGTLVLHPCVSQFQMYGLAQFLKLRGPAHSAIHIVVPIFYPNWTAWGKEAVHAGAHYRRIYDALKRHGNGRVHVFSETQSTADAHRVLAGADIGIMPAPVRVPAAGKAAAGRNADFPVVGFFGYAKAEKGFHLLPGAIAGQKASANLRFVIQSQHDRSDPAIVRAETELYGLANVRLIDSALDREAYYAAFSGVDIVAVPYDPDGYRERGSAVVSEAVALGKPLVTSPHTWAADAIARGDCAGIVMRDWSPGALAEAFAKAAEEIDDLSEKALQCSLRWQKERSFEASCDLLMSLATDADRTHCSTDEGLDFSFAVPLPADLHGAAVRLLLTFSKAESSVFDVMLDTVAIRRVRGAVTSASIDIPISMLEPGKPARISIRLIAGDDKPRIDRCVILSEQTLHQASLCRLGEDVDLRQESEQVLYLGGWGKFDGAGRWANGRVSEMVLMPAESTATPTLHLDLQAPNVPEGTLQLVEIWIAGEMVAEKALRKGSNALRVLLKSATWQSDQPVSIRFAAGAIHTMPDSREPASFYLSRLMVDAGSEMPAGGHAGGKLRSVIAKFRRVKQVQNAR